MPTFTINGVALPQNKKAVEIAFPSTSFCLFVFFITQMSAQLCKSIAFGDTDPAVLF